MKTTIDIAPSILQEAKKAARQENKTLKQLVEEGLKFMLARKKIKFAEIKLVDLPKCGGGFRDEFKNADWSKIREEIYKGRGE